MNETEFPALGQKRTGDYGISISSGRAPNSPSQAPSRPQSISDHQVTSLTRAPEPALVKDLKIWTHFHLFLIDWFLFSYYQIGEGLNF